MTIVQPLKGARKVDVEFQVTVVVGLVDSLETTDEVLMNVAGEWLRCLDLVVGGSVEVKDPSGSGKDLGKGQDGKRGR